MHCEPKNEPRYDIAHIVARIAGEEGRDHPRQKAVARLRARGLEDRVADFNKSYDRHSRDYLPPRDAVDRAISDTLTWGDLSTF